MKNHRRQTARPDPLRTLTIILTALCLLFTACSQFPIEPPAATNTSVAVEPTSTAQETSPSQQATSTLLPQTDATRTPPTPTPAPTATPVPPRPVTVALPGEPETLHPLYATSASAQTVLGALFVGCIGQDEKGMPVALGCERVPTLDNGDAKLVGEGSDRHLEVTFRIRSGWRWTDGAPVTSQDAVYTWQLIMSPAAQIDDALTQKVFAMTAPDERTVVVSFLSAAQARQAATGKLRGDVAFEYFSDRGVYDAYAKRDTPLADPNYWAVLRWLPAHLLKDVTAAQQITGTFATKPIGDGAYELATWNRGNNLTLRRSARPFPLSSAGNVPAITFTFAQGEAGMAMLLQSGQAQVSLPLSPGLLTTGTYTITPIVAPLFEQIALNIEHFPFDDVKVRQALQYAIDASAIISGAAVDAPVVSAVVPAQVVDPAGIFNAPAQTGAEIAPGYDLARAKALLAEAGWSCVVSPCVKAGTGKRGQVITQTLAFTLVTNEREPRNAVSQIIQKQLATAGFGVDIQIVRGLGRNSRLFAPYEQDGILLTRNFDAALYQAPALPRFTGVFDCASVPTDKSHAPTQGNVFGYCDATTDAGINIAETGEESLSTTTRAKVYGDVFQAIGDSALFKPLYSPLWIFPIHDIANVKYLGIGVVTWNAWEWIR